MVERKLLKYFFSTAGFVLTFLLSLVFLNSQALADVSNIYPQTPADATYYCRPSIECPGAYTNSPIYLTVGSGEFDNHISYTKVYSTGTSYTVNIIEGTVCGTAQNDGYQSVQPPDIYNSTFSTRFDFTDRFTNVIESEDLGYDCSNRNRSVDVTLPASSFNSVTGRYEGYIIANMVSASIWTNENSFRYEFTGAEAGPGNPGGDATYSFSNRNISSSYVHDLSVVFAPNCTMPQTGSGTIEIYDVDDGEYQGTGSYPSLTWEGFSRPRQMTGSGGWASFGSGTLTGGDGDTDDLPFTYNSNLEYRLVIRGLSRPNAFLISVTGVSVEDFPASFTCNRPPEVSLSASCTRNTTTGLPVLEVDVTASDPDGDSLTINGTTIGGRTFSGDQTWNLAASDMGVNGNAEVTVSDGKGGSDTASASFTCPANNPPTGSYSAVCSSIAALPVKRDLTISTSITDPDNGATVPLRITANDPGLSGATLATANGTYTSPFGGRNPSLNGTTYTVTFEAQDDQSKNYETVGTRDYFCYRNPAVVSCSITTPGSLEPGGYVEPRVQVSSSPGLNGSLSYQLTRSGSHVPGSPQSVSSSPLNGTYSVSGGHFSAIQLNDPGRYDQAALASFVRAVPDDPSSAVCGGSANVDVAQKPYFKVVGGDVITFYSATQIRGWNQALATISYTAGTPVPCATAGATTHGRCGAAVQGTILAAGTGSESNSGVKSGFIYNGPKFHTLANVGSGVAGSLWGGGFSTPSGMLPPVFSAVGAIPLSSPWAGDTNFSSRATYYVTGDLHITGNTAYSAGSFSSIATVPYLRVIASGNIYIDPAVSQLDGEYIAGGNVYTCGIPAWGNVPNAAYNIFNLGCNSTLTVNGSLIGDSVHLTRVAGTLRAATDDEMRWNGSSYPNRANIAEVINFTPEIYLSNPGGIVDFPAGTRYDSIIALPPVF